VHVNDRQVEQRKWERIPMAVPMFVRGTHNGKTFAEFGTALNVSAGGVLLAVRHYLPPNTSVTLEIPSAPLPASALLHSARTIAGRPVRVEAADNHTLLAIQFDQPLVVHSTRSTLSRRK
jgi:hypothetical protein